MMLDNCIGVILAGGKSSRMGSDKAELVRGEHSMLAFCRQLLGECGIGEIRISRNKGQGIRDVYPDCGPLGGIHAGIRDLTGMGALILPVDMPLLQSKDLQRLIVEGQRLGVPTYYQDCYLPIYLPVSTALVSYLETQLSTQGNLKVRALVRQFEGVALPCDNLTNLINTNTPQQWHETQPFISSRG